CSCTRSWRWPMPGPSGRHGWLERPWPCSRSSCSRSLFSPRSSSPGAYPAIDHPTPWIYLAPHIADGQVAAGPGRILAIVAALGCALVVARRWRAIRTAGRWGPGALTELLWWTAVALALRSAFEPVMVSYYLWPPLAVALAAAASDWSRLLPVGCTTVGLTFFSQVQWHNPWSWWSPMVAGLVLSLFFARH